MQELEKKNTKIKIEKYTNKESSWTWEEVDIQLLQIGVWVLPASSDEVAQQGKHLFIYFELHFKKNCICFSYIKFDVTISH